MVCVWYRVYIMGDRSIVYIMDVINQLLTAGHQLSGSCTYRSDCVAAPAFFGQFERFSMGMVPLEFRVAFPFHVCWLQFFARQLFAKYPDLLCSETHFLLVKSLFLLGEIPIARSPPGVHPIFEPPSGSLIAPGFTGLLAVLQDWGSSFWPPATCWPWITGHIQLSIGPKSRHFLKYTHIYIYICMYVYIYILYNIYIYIHV